MKNVKTCLLLFFIMASPLAFSQAKSFYDFKAKTLEGGDFDFSILKGRKL